MNYRFRIPYASDYLCFENNEYKGLYSDLIKVDVYRWYAIPIVSSILTNTSNTSDISLPTAVELVVSNDSLPIEDNSVCDTTASMNLQTKENKQDKEDKEKEGENKMINKTNNSTNIRCKKCGAPMVIKISSYGTKFLGCSNYPKCYYSESYYENKPEQTLLEKMLEAYGLKGIYINENNGTITAVRSEGSSFSAKVSGDDEFDPRIGVALVLGYSIMHSKSSFNNAVKELMNSKQFHIAKKEPKAKKKDDDKKENN